MDLKQLKIKLGKLVLDTPVLPASGTFGYGDELQDVTDYKFLGAIITKTLTWEQTQGNPPPRIWEFENGLMNSIGLQNIGVRCFASEKLSCLKKLKKPIIVSVGGKSPEDILKCIEFLDRKNGISAFELNLSCPNIKTSKIISEDPRSTFNIIKKVKKITDKIVIAKLSPNVRDICETGIAAEEAGADILCAVNTYKGLYYDWNNKKMYTGGVSGSMIFPMALRAVYELYQKVSIPIIGVGGISSEKRALEMIFAGASAIGLGTFLIINPELPMKICKFLIDYLKTNHTNLQSIIGLYNEKRQKETDC